MTLLSGNSKKNSVKVIRSLYNFQGLLSFLVGKVLNIYWWLKSYCPKINSHTPETSGLIYCYILLTLYITSIGTKLCTINICTIMQPYLTVSVLTTDTLLHSAITFALAVSTRTGSTLPTEKELYLCLHIKVFELYYGIETLGHCQRSCLLFMTLQPRT